MAGVRSKPNSVGKFQGWYVNSQGKQQFFTGTHTRKETLRIAHKLEDEHRLVRLGYVAEPPPSVKHKTRLLADVIDEYIEWGKSHGGREGRPWSKKHYENRKARLEWWEEISGEMATVGDMESIAQQKVELGIVRLRDSGLAPKTLATYVEAFRAFFGWCAKRGVINKNPLETLPHFDTTAVTRRRALTVDEIHRLLAVCEPHRRLLLETALSTGLRANELRSLSEGDVDVANGLLRLSANWTKNRKACEQPISLGLAQQLVKFSQSGEPSRLYRFIASKRRVTARVMDPIPNKPLLCVPLHPARELDKDLKKAGIPKHTDEGKVDFHACRVAYITLIVESGASIKEAQTLARHSSPTMTFNTYSRVRGGRLASTVESVSERINGNSPETEK